MSTPAYNNMIWLLLSEELNEAFPRQHKPEYYIAPVITTMTLEWRKTKRRLADAIVAAATKARVPIQAERIYDLENTLSNGLLIGGRVATASITETTQLSLTEAKISGLGQLGIGRVRDAKGNLVDVYFDKLDAKAWADMSKNWSDIEYGTMFSNYVRDPSSRFKGIVLQDSKGVVHGAAIYEDSVSSVIYNFQEKGVNLKILETAPFDRGQQGLSGVGSNLLGRIGEEVKEGGKLFLESAEKSQGFYDKVGMHREHLGSKSFNWDADEAQAFAQKMGVSKTGVREIVKDTTEVEFTAAKNAQMRREMDSILKDYKVTTTNLIADALKKAKSDTIPQLTSVGTGRGGFTTVMLSKEGMKEVVDGLQWQKDFVDNVSKSVIDRVRGITKDRYASSYDLRKNIDRSFRIDRDKSLGSFRSAVDGHAQSMMKGNITPAQFEKNMMGSIEQNYRKLYKEGKGVPFNAKLERWEEEFIKKQVHGQEQYLSNFRSYIESKQGLGQELTSRVSQRAGLYAERGTAMFEAGHVSSLPDDVLLDWEMQPAEHCLDCPDYEAGSPYTKDTLPGYPGEGFHLSACGTNCCCTIGVNKLYVTQTPEPEMNMGDTGEE